MKLLAVKKRTTTTRKSPFSWHRMLLSWWFPFLVCFILLEVGVLLFLANTLDSQHHLSTASLRRKFLRFMNPQWRQKHPTSKNKNSRDSLLIDKNPVFDHSQLSARGRYLYLDNNNNNNNNQKAQQKHNNTKTSLDNYYARAHIPSSERVPFLIVGGSDGSGTRSVVTCLLELGVTMIVDDFNTMDVHGEEMILQDDNDNHKHSHGWPPLVQIVLNATHSVANYTVQDLPHNVQQKAIKALIKLKSSLIAKGKETARNFPVMTGTILQHPPAPTAVGVQYGWKAPISIVLLPLLKHVFGPRNLKFIHVVRDGRDIALSENQSPLEKYYRVFYGKSHDFNLLRADQMAQSMQLWNDWNYQVLQWEQKQARSKESVYNNNDIDGENNENDNKVEFDYLVLRTEDLIQPETRFAALVQLAEFVGAKLTPEELCCQSRKPLQDLGQSGLREGGPPEIIELERLQRKGAEDEKNVKGRYGKWKQKLQDKPELTLQLQKIGQSALRAFGYEPPARFLDDAADDVIHAYDCETKIRERKIRCKW